MSIINITLKNHYLTKLNLCFSKAGISVIYGTLLLFYALKDPKVPIKAKVTIISVLGYFISTVELIADPIPVAGYRDDLIAIITAFGMISIFIISEIKRKVTEKTKEWFSNVGEEDFREIDKTL